MADNLTDFTENKVLEHSVGRTAWTAPTHTYLALYTVSPTDSTAGTEVTGGGYARVQLTWGAASAGQISITAPARFPASGTASANFGTVVAMGICDAVTEGHILWYAPLSPTFTINALDSFTVIEGGITLALS